MITKKRKLGDLGEEIAEKYLKKHGYIILGRNYSKKWGELDIIAKFEKGIVFVEVKTRKKGSSILPAHNVDFYKQQRLIRAAYSWFLENKNLASQELCFGRLRRRNKIPAEIGWQIDVIVVELDYENKSAKVEHLRNAVRAGR